MPRQTHQEIRYKKNDFELVPFQPVSLPDATLGEYYAIVVLVVLPGDSGCPRPERLDTTSSLYAQP